MLNISDGIGHYPDTSANNVYVELINSDGKAMAMRILLAEDGYAAGDMNLHAELPEGNYILRAYTDWMRNFGEEYYYAKNMYINNPGYENMIPRIDVLKNMLFNWKIDRMRSDYQIAFFPEGGNLLAAPARPFSV
ncbi:MAG: hypothetical protein R6U58_04485 [Bacteroidales bacterium]